MAGLSSILSKEMVENRVLSNKLVERAYDVAISYGSVAPSKRSYFLKEGDWEVIYTASRLRPYTIHRLMISQRGDTVFSAWANVPYPSSVSEPVISTEGGKTWAISEFGQNGWEGQFLQFYAGKTGKAEPPGLPKTLICEVSNGES